MKQVRYTANHFNYGKCDFSAYSEFVLKRHVVAVHAAKTLYPCDKCSFASNVRCRLKKHYERVHGDGLKTVPCPHCELLFRTKSHLSKHLLTAHDILYKY